MFVKKGSFLCHFYLLYQFAHKTSMLHDRLAGCDLLSQLRLWRTKSLAIKKEELWNEIFLSRFCLYLWSLTDLWKVWIFVWVWALFLKLLKMHLGHRFTLQLLDYLQAYSVHNSFLNLFLNLCFSQYSYSGLSSVFFLNSCSFVWLCLSVFLPVSSLQEVLALTLTFPGSFVSLLHS